MKFGLSLFWFLLAFFSFNIESFSLTDYQIKKYCSKEKRESSCISNLREKRYILQKGKLIQIPVEPYKR